VFITQGISRRSIENLLSAFTGNASAGAMRHPVATRAGGEGAG